MFLCKSVNFAEIFCCGAGEHETRESRPPEAHNDEHSFNEKIKQITNKQITNNI